MRAQDLVALWLAFFEKRKGPLRKDDWQMIGTQALCKAAILVLSADLCVFLAVGSSPPPTAPKSFNGALL